MSLAVHLLREADAALLAYLRDRLHPDVTLTVGRELPEPADYQILVAGRPEREHISASPDLQALIILTLPLTAETEGLIGSEELALLPPRSVLVNVGRGPIVEEEALYHALSDGTLRGWTYGTTTRRTRRHGRTRRPPPTRFMNSTMW